MYMYITAVNPSALYLWDDLGKVGKFLCNLPRLHGTYTPHSGDLWLQFQAAYGGGTPPMLHVLLTLYMPAESWLHR